MQKHAVMVYLQREQKDIVDALAKTYGISASAVLERAFTQWVEGLED